MTTAAAAAAAAATSATTPWPPVCPTPTRRLTECSRARGRQNEPAVAIDPRNPQVIVGSSNDYCGVYNDGVDADGAPIPSGPIWLGYYRSENGGASFTSSLVPGYPGDTSPYAALAQVRTASAGDPVIAWDGHGRVFVGSESSGDPAGSTKTFGDVWVARFENPGARRRDDRDGASIPGRRCRQGLGGAEPARQVQRQDGDRGRPHRRPLRRQRLLRVVAFHRQRGSNIYFARSTDHGATFSVLPESDVRASRTCRTPTSPSPGTATST